MLKHLLILLLSVPLFGFAEQTDRRLSDCYLAGDMRCWETYISQCKPEELAGEERRRLINTLYGYIPATYKENKDRAKELLELLTGLISDNRGCLSPADSLAYMSAAQAYVCMLYHIKALTYAPKAFRNAKRATESAGDNATALSVAANIYFYCPSIIGGDKKEALRLYLKAEEIMTDTAAADETAEEQKSRWHNSWNYPAVMLCIAQCYDHLGETDKAIEQARKTLRLFPDFVYVRDTYLPALSGKKASR